MRDTARARRTIPRAPHPLELDARNGRAPNLAHLDSLCHHLGVVQFACGETRDIGSGFCVDDNARALIVAVEVLGLDPRHAVAHRIGDAALRLLERTQLGDDGFHNLLGEHGEFVRENGRSEDANGRAFWALGVTAARALDETWRARAEALLAKTWSAAGRLEHVRPRAYAVLGAAAIAHRSAQAKDVLARLAAALLESYTASASPSWPWWEPELTWANARLPEAMLRAGAASDTPGAVRECGLRALEFLGAVTHERGMFVPIGNDGWYPRDAKRARHDQQPIEAAAMVDAWLAAFDLTGDERYRAFALEAFAWFFGANTERLLVADPQTGGCHDGLRRGGRNRNMGAESTLSYLQAHAAIARQAASR